MKYILSVDNILVDSLEVYQNGYFEAQPLPGIRDFLRTQVVLNNEIIIICSDKKQKFFVTKNFPFVRNENIIIYPSFDNQIELIENILGRDLSDDDRLIDSPPHLIKLNKKAEVVIAINDMYLFDISSQDCDLSRYIDIYNEMKIQDTF